MFVKNSIVSDICWDTVGQFSSQQAINNHADRLLLPDKWQDIPAPG